MSNNGLLVVKNPFINIDEKYHGVEANLKARFDLPKDVRLGVDADLNWSLRRTQTLADGSQQSLLGGTGYPTFDGNVDWRLDRGPWTLNYYLYMVGPTNDGMVTTVLFPESVVEKLSTPFYTTSSISLRRKFDKFTVEAGIKNLFNRAPPSISNLDPNLPLGVGLAGGVGSVPTASQYDWIGRSFFFDIDARF